MSPSSTIAAGSTGELVFSSRNEAGSGVSNCPTSITDSVGNLWRRRVSRISALTTNTGVEHVVYICTNLITALTSSDNVTITYTTTNVGAKAWTFVEIAPVSGKVAILGDTSSTGALVSASTGPNFAFPVSTSTDAILVGAIAAKSADTFTGATSWSTQQHVSPNSNISLSCQYRQRTTAGAVLYTYDPTLTSANIGYSVLEFVEVEPTVRGVPSSTFAATTWTVNFRIGLSVGSMGVFVIACDNAGSNGSTKVAPNSITDGQGNTWTQRLDTIYDPGAAAAGAELAIYTAPITTALGITDNMTVTWDSSVSVDAMNGVIYEFVPGPGNSMSYVSAGSGSTGAASTTGVSGSVTAGDTIIGAVAAEGPDTFTGDSDTTHGSWSILAHHSSGTGTTNEMAIASQYKTVSGTANQSYETTLTSADTSSNYIIIRGTQKASHGFFSLTN